MVDKVSLVENISSKAGTANAKNCSVMLVSLRLGLRQLNLSRWNWDAPKLKANLWAIQCFPCRLGFPPQLMHPPVLCNVWFVLCISSFPKLSTNMVHICWTYFLVNRKKLIWLLKTNLRCVGILLLPLFLHILLTIFGTHLLLKKNEKPKH